MRRTPFAVDSTPAGSGNALMEGVIGKEGDYVLRYGGHGAVSELMVNRHECATTDVAWMCGGGVTRNVDRG